MTAAGRWRVELGAAPRTAIARGGFVRVELGDGTSALVGRCEGAWRAFANVCKHRAIALDLGADTPMASDGVHLLCHQHGALYRATDGLCVGGPCVGEKLDALDVAEEGDALLLSANASRNHPRT